MAADQTKSPPAALKRRMPAEWERHDATWMQWPSSEGASFPGVWTARVEPKFAYIIEQISQQERVELAVRDEREAERVGELLLPEARERTVFHSIESSEPWCRDIGPTFVVDEDPDGNCDLVAVKWRFNGWGEQWPYELDQAAGERIAQVSAQRIETPDLVFEGGGVESNGAGVLLVTEECLLDPHRNPGLSREAVEQVLCRHLGAGRVIWLRGGVAGDDTGHTDVIARFVNERTVAVLRASDSQHPDFELLEDNRRRLDEEGFEIVDMPVLDPEYNEDIKDYLPKSYVNFYAYNSKVMVPAFEVSEDYLVADLYADCFPGREIVRVDCNDLVFGQGGIHCLTQQLPA